MNGSENEITKTCESMNTHWLATRNGKSVNRDDIPCVDIRVLRSESIARCRSQNRPVSFFGVRDLNNTGKVRLYIVLADDAQGRLFLSSAELQVGGSYPSFTPELPALHMFERELWEEFGIKPDDHPWLKPVRYAKNRSLTAEKPEDYKFFAMIGESVHEVGVGPVHAGVIEPGHFRFNCVGEDVHHLEIQLGYQHRGVEDLFAQQKPGRYLPHLAESIAGDTVVGHTTAYVHSMESLAGIEVSRKAAAVRAIALELERAAIHVGDLGAIANDIGFLIGNSFYGARRTLLINSLLAICGSRFGRGLIRVGGVNYDISADLRATLRKTLESVETDVREMSEVFFAAPDVLSRLQKTGVVDKETASQAGLVGMAARASDVCLDVREDHPYGWYRFAPVHPVTMETGDVFARAFVRYGEITQSLHFIYDQFDAFPDEDPLRTKVEALQPNRFVVSMVEGWRGEIAHTAITGPDGQLVRYKIKDPSFHNWFGLALALRNNGISDFPLCNKSFNLSYCGHDL